MNTITPSGHLNKDHNWHYLSVKTLLAPTMNLSCKQRKYLKQLKCAIPSNDALHKSLVVTYSIFHNVLLHPKTYF